MPDQVKGDLPGEYILLRCRVLPASLIVFLLTACGGSNTTPTTSTPTTPVPTTPAPAAPVFTSAPNTQAAEGSPYSYQLAATGGAVTFSLSNAPTGATLSGSTLSWTPTAQQSRTLNSFTVTATATGAPSATQSWAVTPSGTIRISHIDTLWNQSGSTNKAFDWSPVSSIVAALVPQPDGSFQSLSGTAGANGAFEIPNVPAGYYWLRLGPRDTYWTSSSTFDVGGDYSVPAANPTAPTTSTTYLDFSFTSLDPTAVAGLLQFDALETPVASYLASTIPGSTTFLGGSASNTNLDYSVIKNAFVRQYEPAAFGSMDGYVLGPALTLSNLSLATGGHNAISGVLDPTVPASINLSVKGSAWAPLFDHIAPTSLTAVGGSFFLSVQPYIPADGPNVSSFSRPIDLIWTDGKFSAFLTPSCQANPPSMTDVEAGTVRYSDPFPSSWRRIFRICQSAKVAVERPGGKIQGIVLTNTQTTLPPTAAVKPLISAVQNPKINGADLFSASTLNDTTVTLSWDPPAIGTPFGYSVTIVGPTVSPSGEVIYSSSATLSMAKTSMTIPPDLLRPGQTYLFGIASLVDGSANMETSPHRSSLPTGSAEMISASITTQ